MSFDFSIPASTETKRWAWRLALPLGLLMAWQLAAAFAWAPRGVLAAPAQTLATAARMIADGSLPTAIGVSMLRAGAGFLIGGTIGTVLGLAAGLSRTGEWLIDGTAQMLRTIPFVTLTPVFIVWFGIGESAKLAIVAFATLFPLYLNAYAGVRQVDARLIESARAADLRGAALLREVIFPGALPALLVGLRYSLALSVLALVVAEQINTSDGIGALLADARRFVRIDVMAVCIVTYALIGWLSNRFVRALESHLLRWRAPSKPGTRR